MASARDLVTVLYEPRETMRRVLDSSDRWTIPLVVLAFICTSFGDSDLRGIDVVLPNMSLSGKLALVALCIIGLAALWVGILYLVAWVTTMIGRQFGGEGTVADVRTALAWALVPGIWFVIFRIPIAIYKSRFVPQTHDQHRALMEFIRSGGCMLAILVGAFQMLLYLWTAYVASYTLAEALRFSPLKGLGTLAATLALPIIVGVAAVLAMR